MKTLLLGLILLSVNVVSANSSIDPPTLNAQSVLVLDQVSGEQLLTKNITIQTPIASITKLMTAILIMNANQSLDELIIISTADRDTLKRTTSRLAVGSSYTRGQLIHLALIASDNRAAHALGRSYPGGMKSFVFHMNSLAHEIGMDNTVYVEPTGLSSGNRSTALDQAKLVDYAYQNYPEISHISGIGYYALDNQRVVVNKKRQKSQVVYRQLVFNNTNRFTRVEDWHIGLSKTGFTTAAGHCLVMQTQISGRDVIIVILDAAGNNRRTIDVTRIKDWITTNYHSSGNNSR